MWPARYWWLQQWLSNCRASATLPNLSAFDLPITACGIFQLENFSNTEMASA
jgi:hypothetical protein